MKRSYLVPGALILCALFLVTIPMLGGQVVAPPSSPVQIQLFPPGSAGVIQTPFVLTGSSGGAAAITLTQAAQPGHVNYCTGLEISGGGATAASDITATLASGGTTIMNFNIPVPAGATGGITPIIVQFSPPIPGNGPGQTMVLSVPSFGAGNTASFANLHGFNQ